MKTVLAGHIPKLCLPAADSSASTGTVRGATGAIIGSAHQRIDPFCCSTLVIDLTAGIKVFTDPAFHIPGRKRIIFVYLIPERLPVPDGAEVLLPAGSQPKSDRVRKDPVIIVRIKAKKPLQRPLLPFTDKVSKGGKFFPESAPVSGKMKQGTAKKSRSQRKEKRGVHIGI